MLVLMGLCAGVACPAAGSRPNVGGAGVGGGQACDAGASSMGTGGGIIALTCAQKCLPLTTITGTVYDPAGKVPLSGIFVYVANGKPATIDAGNPTCTQCQAQASGGVLTSTFTDASGSFTLKQDPMDPFDRVSGSGLTLVLQSGKWRRQYPLHTIQACSEIHISADPTNPSADPTKPSDRLRLPAKGSEGDMPLIAFTSGGCDVAECFLRDIGIDDSEFVSPKNPGNGHVVFYTGQNDNGSNASQISGGNDWSDTYAWWTDVSNLKKYDIIFNACECHPNDRGTGAYSAMEDYLKSGGRLFATHYYSNWFTSGPLDEQGVASWKPLDSAKTYTNYYIDTNFPKGKLFADWLQNQSITLPYGQIALADTSHDVDAINDAGQSTRWIYNADMPDDAGTTPYSTTYMSFNSPVGAPFDQQCGRAVFSDVHLSGTYSPNTFPLECPTSSPDPMHARNERALEFLFFDLTSCVQNDVLQPMAPPK
jgi:hypothetical protein